jgi:hypothetical protein
MDPQAFSRLDGDGSPPLQADPTTETRTNSLRRPDENPMIGLWFANRPGLSS